MIVGRVVVKIINEQYNYYDRQQYNYNLITIEHVAGECSKTKAGQ